MRRWLRAAHGLPEGARVAALLPRSKLGRRPELDPEQQGTLAALVFDRGSHLTAGQVRKVLIARHQRPVALRTVQRWLARFRANHTRALSAVTNPDHHRSHRKPAGGDAAEGIDRLNQLWELDSTRADVMCNDGRRYAIVAAIDVWSRRFRVLVSPESRATAIAALLRRCMLEWGVPESVRTDQGRDYTSRHVVGVLADLEIEHLLCPPYTPEAKPFVERALGTLTRGLFAFLPGFTGHDVAQAKALHSRKSFAARRGQGARESFHVALTAEELQERIDMWCEAVYGREPHAGIGGQTPFLRAASWPEPVRRIHDERWLDALLAEPAGDGVRTIGKKGIRVDGGVYIAAELGPFVGERVKLRRDPTDLGRIHVYLHDGPEAGAFLCIAEDPARTGMDRAKVAAQMKANAKAVDREAREWARGLKRLHRPETMMDDVLAHAASEAGRVVMLPRKGTTHQTPALTEAARATEANGGDDTSSDLVPAWDEVAAARRAWLKEEGWL